MFLSGSPMGTFSEGNELLAGRLGRRLPELGRFVVEPGHDKLRSRLSRHDVLDHHRLVILELPPCLAENVLGQAERQHPIHDLRDSLGLFFLPLARVAA